MSHSSPSRLLHYMYDPAELSDGKPSLSLLQNPVPNRHRRFPFPPSKGSKDPILAPPLTISAVTCDYRVIGTDRQIPAGRRGFSCSEWAMVLKGCEGRRMGGIWNLYHCKDDERPGRNGICCFSFIATKDRLDTKCHHLVFRCSDGVLESDWLDNESFPGHR